MQEKQLLENIIKDIDFLKERILVIEQEVKEINEDLHIVKPEYIEDLKQIEKQKTISESEFERKFDVDI